MLGALGAQIEAAEPPPSAELLLYLGEFEDASGEFADPMALTRQDRSDRRLIGCAAHL
jgi:hypothetical protein